MIRTHIISSNGTKMIVDRGTKGGTKWIRKSKDIVIKVYILKFRNGRRSRQIRSPRNIATNKEISSTITCFIGKHKVVTSTCLEAKRDIQVRT